MTDSEIFLGLPQYEITAIDRTGGTITISARHAGPILCPNCGGSRLRNKGWCRRTVRHDDWGFRQCVLRLEVRKSRCLDCGRTFRQQVPGIQPFQRASESFQEMVFQQHRDGINRSCLGRRKGIGAATVQRYFVRASSAERARITPRFALRYWASTSTSAPAKRVTPPLSAI